MKSDKGIYSNPIAGRQAIWSNEYEGIYRPVYGWAGEKRQKIKALWGLASKGVAAVRLQ